MAYTVDVNGSPIKDITLAMACLAGFDILTTWMVSPIRDLSITSINVQTAIA